MSQTALSQTVLLQTVSAQTIQYTMIQTDYMSQDCEHHITATIPCSWKVGGQRSHETILHMVGNRQGHCRPTFRVRGKFYSPLYSHVSKIEVASPSRRQSVPAVTVVIHVVREDGGCHIGEPLEVIGCT